MTRRSGEGSCQDHSAGNDIVLLWQRWRKCGPAVPTGLIIDGLNRSSRCVSSHHHAQGTPMIDFLPIDDLPCPVAAAIAALVSTSSSSTISRAPPRLLPPPAARSAARHAADDEPAGGGTAARLNDAPSCCLLRDIAFRLWQSARLATPRQRARKSRLLAELRILCPSNARHDQ